MGWKSFASLGSSLAVRGGLGKTTGSRSRDSTTAAASAFCTNEFKACFALAAVLLPMTHNTRVGAGMGKLKLDTLLLLLLLLQNAGSS